MQKIKPENVFCCFNDFLSRKKAENLTSVTIAKCICFIKINVVGHNKNYECHCFNCQVCGMLISVRVKTKRIKLLFLVRIKLLFLVNNKNYNTVSNEKLLKSYDIWA